MYLSVQYVYTRLESGLEMLAPMREMREKCSPQCPIAISTTSTARAVYTGTTKEASLVPTVGIPPIHTKFNIAWRGSQNQNVANFCMNF